MKEKYSFFGPAKTEYRENGTELDVVKDECFQKIKNSQFFKDWFIGLVLGDIDLGIFNMDKEGEYLGYRDIPKDFMGGVMYINLHLDLWIAKYKYHNTFNYNDEKFREAAEKALSEYFDDIHEYKVSKLIKK